MEMKRKFLEGEIIIPLTMEKGDDSCLQAVAYRKWCFKDGEITSECRIAFKNANGWRLGKEIYLNNQEISTLKLVDIYEEYNPNAIKEFRYTPWGIYGV